MIDWDEVIELRMDRAKVKPGQAFELEPSKAAVWVFEIGPSWPEDLD